jgi:glycosyltransferase involved in cell wall biosynthesis
MARVTIVVPCYNQAKFLGCCLNSLIAQTFKHWTCIIIDDGSTDNSQVIAEQWAQIDSRISFYSIPNSGVCEARNYGIGKSVTEFILPLDADDYLSPDYLTLVYDAIANKPEIKVAYGRVATFGLHSNIHSNQGRFNFDKLLEDNYIHCAGIFRRNDFTRIGGYDREMVYGWEDWEFWIALLKDGGDALEVDGAFLFYRQTVKPSRNNDLLQNNLRMNAMREYIFNKHHKSYTEESYYGLYKFYKNHTNSTKHLYARLSYRNLFSMIVKKSIHKFIK